MSETVIPVFCVSSPHLFIASSLGCLVALLFFSLFSCTGITTVYWYFDCVQALRLYDNCSMTMCEYSMTSMSLRYDYSYCYHFRYTFTVAFTFPIEFFAFTIPILSAVTSD